MKDFRDKVAAITGAGSGIGQALALELAASGCHLALADVNADGLARTVEKLQGYPVKVTHTVLDVSDRIAVEAWADATVLEHRRVNMIFNNAGVALSGTVAGLSIEDYEWITNINFWGVVYGTKAFLPHLEASGEGHVINISSVFGLSSQPLMSGYNATKFAVRGFTESLCQDLALTNSCVRATCVHPGGIRTNIARASRQTESVQSVMGMDAETAAADFEKLFITRPRKAASVILNAVRKERRRVLIGLDAKLLDLLVRLFPVRYQTLVTAATRTRQRGR